MAGPYWGTQWNPTVGCDTASEGCAHCWARTIHNRFHTGLPGAPEQYREPFSHVRTMPDRLAVPLHWRKPRTCFVCNTSDLYHPAVPFEFIEEVFTIMLISSLHDTRFGHTFLLLTKRADRMLKAIHAMDADRMAVLAGRRMEDGDGWHDVIWRYVRDHGPVHDKIWLGVTAENQARADERIPLLLQTPAAHRWVSLEPLLGPVEIVNGRANRWSLPTATDSRGRGIEYTDPGESFLPLDQIVAGGESGPGARPCDVEWLRSIVRQGRDASVPVFNKQLGSNVRYVGDGHPAWLLDLRSRSGSDPDEWPEDLKVRELAWRLDGRVWAEVPE